MVEERFKFYMDYGNWHFHPFNQVLLLEFCTTDYYNGQRENAIYGIFI